MGAIIEGIIHNISAISQPKENFRVREVIIKTVEQYEQYIPVQLINDRTQFIEQYSIGETVKLHCNIKGRRYTNNQLQEKSFLSLECWKIEQAAGTAPAQQQPPGNPGKQQITEPLNKANEPEGLPF